jgi:surfeit locus 1 family protein
MGLRGQSLLVWLGAVVAVLATVTLGLWQLDRAAQKTALLQVEEQRIALAPLPVPQLARTAAEAAQQHHRTIRVAGRWLERHTVYLDNRPLEGRSGFIVVTPLLLGPGDAVLVQRGWAPRDAADRTRLPRLATPDGEVMLHARIAALPSTRLALQDKDDGPIRQNLDAAALQRATGVPLRPLTLLQLPEGAADDALVRQWPAPAQDVWKNYGYAFQWFALAALIGALTVWYRILGPSRAKRR